MQPETWHQIHRSEKMLWGLRMSENIFAQMLQRYSGDPAGWVRDMVGIEVDPWQASVMDQVAQRGPSSWQFAVGTGWADFLCLLDCPLVLFHHFPCKIVITHPPPPEADG